MTQETRISPRGVSNVTGLLGQPGDMLRAEEVVLRKPGVVEPRPGFSAAAITAYVRAVPCRGVALRVDISGTETNLEGYSVDKEDNTDVGWSQPYINAVDMRGNTYLTTSDMLRKYEGSLAVAPGNTRMASIPALSLTLVSRAAGYGPVTAGNDRTAYRALLMRKDENGLISRGAPSGRFLYGVGGTMTMRVHLPALDLSAVAAGDTVELYRTMDEVLVDPSDELYLCASVVLTAADISAEYLTIVDSVREADLGQALYTNALQEGAAAAHIEVPQAKALASYHGSLWCGNLTYAPSVTISFNFNMVYALCAPGAQALLDSQLCVYKAADTGTATLTNGSTTISTLTSTEGLKIGMILILAVGSVGNTKPANFSSGGEYVRITSIPNTTSVVVSAAYTGATSAVEVAIFTDSIRIGSQYFPVQRTDQMLCYLAGLTDPSGSAIDDPHSPLTSGAFVTNMSDAWPTSVSYTALQQILRFQQVTPTATALQIWATNGHLYTPALPEPTVATGLSFFTDASEAGLAWSNADEPEHFQLVNIEKAPDGGKVLAMVPVKGALLIFTSKGLCRASGHAASGVQLRTVDASVQLCYPAAVTVLGDAAYAFCTRGVFRCTADGAVNISHLRIESFPAICQATGAASETAHGFFAAANPAVNEVYFGVPDVADTGTAKNVWVYNADTDAWTTWFARTPMLWFSYWPTLSGVLCGSAAATYGERTDTTGDVSAKVDTNYVLTIVSRVLQANGTYLVTIGGGSGWTPAVGDVMYGDGSTPVLVVATATATTFYTDGTSAIDWLTAGKAYTSLIEMKAFVAKAPHLLKVWQGGQLWWLSREGLREVTVAFTSPTALARTTASYVKRVASLRVTDSGVRSGDAQAFTVPRAHGRGTRLYVTLQVAQAGSHWALEAVSVGFRSAADKVRERFA